MSPFAMDGRWCLTTAECRGARARAIGRADRYHDYLLVHGLAVEMTEVLAEYWPWRIRQERGFADQDGPTLQGLFRQQYRGSHYWWGCPACPDLEEPAKLTDLLDLDPIGVHLTEEFQLEPERSTSAIVVPHAGAKYLVA
jgi:5-methyltetrahydrofolate--homocysteine methyltransferase